MRAGCGVQELGRGYLIGWDGWALSAHVWGCVLCVRGDGGLGVWWWLRG